MRLRKLALFASLILAASVAVADDRDDVIACLKNWKEHPFPVGKEKADRVLATSVRIFGAGGDLVDDAKTDEPELVLVKPAVSVMTKTTMKLLNPNGWYCLKGKVDVMAKTEITLGCSTHLISSTQGATVLGAQNEQSTGVTVMGKSAVNRNDCDGNSRVE